MENEFLSKVEDNTVVRAWSEKLQSEKGDSLVEGYILELQDFTRINVAQNELQELRDVWASWDEGTKEVDLVPTIEEYTALLRCPRVQVAARIQQKGDSKCIPWENLQDLVLTHPDERKRVDIFALSIYGLVIFPKALRHVDEAVIDLFNRLEKGITPVLAILAETFKSLNTCQKTGEGRFIGCAQLLMVWFHGHFWKVERVSYRVFSKSYSPLKEEAAIQRREDITDEKWIEILQNLKEGDIEWRAYWMVPDEIMYRCGNFDWMPLLGIWGATGYTPLLALRQYKSRQFVPTTYGLAQCEFSFKGAHYKKKFRELSDAWKQTHWMKRLAVGSMMTSEYDGWFKKRVNNNIPRPSLENTRPTRSEAEKWRKGKTKAEEDLDSLKIDYKKLRLSMRTARLDLEKSLSESRNEQGELKARVTELEKSLHQYRNRNTIMELRASLSKIEEMKGRIEELEASLQNCKMRIQFFEVNEERRKEQLHHTQDQVRNRDYIMGEAITQIREVADYLQALAVQADTLSVKYKTESDRGQELALLLRKIRTLSIRAKFYFNLETNKNLLSTQPYGTRTKAMDKKLERLEQMQKEMQEQMQAQVQEQEQLAKIQQEMRDQMLESQKNMIEELTRLLTSRPDKGKSPMADMGNSNGDSLYPLALPR
ncbi:hypothetical protein CXB51_021794 [Gossypium anomalum]|uniref:DUF7745 domain-containing protein n=1 Tax=Gossypium anomalum TaxID=47600 RepID=A0A8J6CS06_9ROSI|nr:hypothetical protein CXB51_021794 [Gossypium anomalum]